MKRIKCFFKGHRFPLEFRNGKIIKIGKCNVCNKEASEKSIKYLKSTYEK